VNNIKYIGVNNLNELAQAMVDNIDKHELRRIIRTSGNSHQAIHHQNDSNASFIILLMFTIKIA
jgi:hypothetical protein